MFNYLLYCKSVVPCIEQQVVNLFNTISYTFEHLSYLSFRSLMVREVIGIHIGQAGVQIGSSLWEQYCIEHGIQPDGILSKDAPESLHETFFSETSAGKHIPRSIFLDLEPTALDEIRSGSHRQLFEPFQLISGKQDAGSNYARGRYTIGKEIIDTALDRIRKLADDCTGLDGFMIFNSVGGGTGSGLGSLLLERLCVDYGKKAKLGVVVHPSPQLSCSSVEPYNAILVTDCLIDYQDISFVYENEAVFGICQKKLDIDSPGYKDLNAIITHTVSCSTLSMRFRNGHGDLNADLSEFQTNLVPYRPAHFLSQSYVPFFPANIIGPPPLTCEELALATFEPGNFTIKCDPKYGKYLTNSIMCQGGFIPKEAYSAIQTLKTTRSIRHVDWYPVDYKVGINYTPVTIPVGSKIAKPWRAVCNLSNNTFMKELFQRNIEKFDDMLAGRAFVHWYLGEGMEEGEFSDTRERVFNLMDDYGEMEEDSPADYEAEQEQRQKN